MKIVLFFAVLKTCQSIVKLKFAGLSAVRWYEEVQRETESDDVMNMSHSLTHSVLDRSTSMTHPKSFDRSTSVQSSIRSSTPTPLESSHSIRLDFKFENCSLAPII